MHVAEGMVVVAQEGRFLLADGSRALPFVLAPGAGIEAQDLPELVRRQRRVAVRYRSGHGMGVGVVHGIEVMEP
jgi:hypothetical protein